MLPSVRGRQLVRCAASTKDVLATAGCGTSHHGAHLQLPRQIPLEPGVPLDVLQRDALVGVCHEDPLDEVLAPVAERYVVGVGVLRPHDFLHGAISDLNMQER